MFVPLRRFLPVAYQFRPGLEELGGRITPSAAFNAAVNFTVGTDARDVATGDFNSDGRADVVTLNRSSKNFTVLLNGTRDEPGHAQHGVPAFGGTSFNLNPPLGEGTRVLYGMAVADINGDGRDDVIVLDQTTSTQFTSGVLVLLNTTALGANTPTFASAQRNVLGAAAGPQFLGVHLVAGDFNGDTRPDLAALIYDTSNGFREVFILKNSTTAFTNTVDLVVSSTPVILFLFNNTTPRQLVAADLNADGRTDLAYIDATVEEVVIVRNTTPIDSAGTITFANAVSSGSVGNDPTAIRTGDFDGDGRIDLAVANEDDGTVSVLRSLPSGGVASKVDIAVGTVPFGLAVGDFTGDGRADIAVTNSGDNMASVVENTTAGGATTVTFAAPRSFAVGNNPLAAVAADFDRDGRADLAVVNQAGNTVSILKNATAPFAAAQALTVGSGSWSVAVGDFDGDGKPDQAVANQNANNVSVLRNTSVGAGSIAFAAQTFATGTGPIAVAVADFNQDGKRDLAVANFAGGTTASTVSVLRNTSTGIGNIAFAAHQTLAAGKGPAFVSVGDFNRDGKVDIAVANYGSGTVSFMRNTSTAGGAISFGAQETFAVGTSPIWMAAGDFNGDNKLDLAVTNAGSQFVSVLRNTSATTGNLTFVTEPNVATGAIPLGLVAADMNGDNKLDLAVANYGTGGNGNSVSVYRNLSTTGGAISFAAQQLVTVGAGPNGLAAFEYFRDGKPDLVVTNFGGGGTGNTVSVLRNTTPAGSATFSFAPHESFTVGTGPRSVAAADFDADGRPDLTVANSGAGTGNTVSVLRNLRSVPVTGPVLVANRGANGLSLYHRTTDTWWPASASSPASHVAAAPNGNLIVVFPGYGTWYFIAAQNIWVQLHTQLANVVAMDRWGNAYANYSNYGTFVFRASNLHLSNPVNRWTKLGQTGATADKLAVGGNGDVAANFLGYGVYRFRPGYTDFAQLRNVEAATLAMGDSGHIVLTYKSQSPGIHMWRDGSTPGFVFLHGYNATNLAVDGNGNVTATFNQPGQYIGVARSRAVPTGNPNNSALDWAAIHQGTAATALAVDLLGNIFVHLDGFGVYEFGIYPGFRQRSTFAVSGLALGR